MCRDPKDRERLGSFHRCHTWLQCLAGSKLETDEGTWLTGKFRRLVHCRVAGEAKQKPSPLEMFDHVVPR